MAGAKLSEAAIRELATAESFRRGEEYLRSGCVTGLVRRGDQLEADVTGSQYAPYRVRVTLADGEVADYECTCPYDWGGACKHVVAALLAYLERPEVVETRPTVESLLAGLDAEALRSILRTLAEQHPDLADAIELQVAAGRATAAAQPAASPSPGAKPAAAAGSPPGAAHPIDPMPYRRQVRAALRSLDRMRSSEAYWQVGNVAAEVYRVAKEAQPFIEAGDARNALSILEAVTDEYVTGWTTLDDSDGDASGLFADLDELWTDALLCAELPRAERQSWAKRFTDWAEELEDYGLDEAFYLAERAAVQGWDDPRLQAILRGEAGAAGSGVIFERIEPPEEADVEWEEADEDEEWDETAEDWDDGGTRLPSSHALTEARLRALERQGRLPEYLNLARATGHIARYVAMLARLGRIEEAVRTGLTGLRSTHEALAAAQALHEHGAVEEALRLAEHGLSLSGDRPEPDVVLRGDKVMLAQWLRDRASAAGRRELALRAALIAQRAAPGLDNYRAIQPLAGERWPELRRELLAELRARTAYYDGPKVDIFLHEGLIDDAIESVKPAGTHYTLVEKVADAAIASRPEWVVETSRAHVERIVAEGKANRYDYAVAWLRRMREAARAAGREAEWRSYVADLIAQHKRKYSLVPRLEQLLKS